MNIGLELMSTNMGVAIESVILLIIILGTLVFFARNVILGFIMMFLSSTGLFILFYSMGWNYAPSLIVTFMSLIFMCFSLYAVNKTVNAGGVV